MSYIDNIAEFLFDEERRLSSKAAVIVFAILAIFIIDNITGFSYHYNTNKKIEELEKINIILKDLTLDSATKEYATNLRQEILERQSVLSQVTNFIRNVKWVNTDKPKPKTTKETPKHVEVITKSAFWFQLSSGGIYYLLAIIIIPIILFADKKTSLPQRIATGILAAALLCGTGLFFFWLFDFIPQISTASWIWNYLLNCFLQVGVMFLLFKANQRKI